MPYIPLLKPNTDLAMPQVPALDRVPRPNIDVRGVLAAMEDLGRASQMPLVDERPFVEAAGAKGRAVGKGLMDIGDVMGALALKLQDAADDRARYETKANAKMAERRMQVHYESEPDATRHEPQLKKEEVALWKAHAGLKNASPEARYDAALDIHAATHAMKVAGAETSAKQDFATAANAIALNMDLALDVGDYAGARKYAEDGRAKLYFDENQFQGLLRKVDDRRLSDTILVNPKAIIAEAEAIPGSETTDYLKGMSEARRIRATNAAAASLFEQKNSLVTRGVQEIANGGVNNPEQLLGWVEQHDLYGVLDEGDKGHLRAELEGRAPRNLPEYWKEGYDRIQSMNLNVPDEVKHLQVAAVRGYIMKRFAGPMQDEMLGILQERLKDWEGSMSADMKAMSELADREATRLFEPLAPLKLDANGQAVVTISEQTTIPEKVRDTMNPLTYFSPRDGTPEDAVTTKVATPVREMDPETKAMADAMKYDVIRSLDQWRRSQPKRPTRVELTAQFYVFARGAMAVQEARKAKKGDGRPASLIPVGTPDEVSAKMSEAMKAGNPAGK